MGHGCGRRFADGRDRGHHGVFFLGASIRILLEALRDENTVSHGLGFGCETQAKVDGFSLGTAFERIISHPFLRAIGLNINMG